MLEAENTQKRTTRLLSKLAYEFVLNDNSKEIVEQLDMLCRAEADTDKPLNIRRSDKWHMALGMLGSTGSLSDQMIQAVLKKCKFAKAAVDSQSQTTTHAWLKLFQVFLTFSVA